MPLNPIYESEWYAYDWTEVSEISRSERMYIRGKKRTPPPVDGYHYERVDRLDEKEYRWERVYEVG